MSSAIGARTRYIYERVGNIRVPTLSPSAVDDPLASTVDTMAKTAKEAVENESIFVLITPVGGHCGWPVGLFPSAWFWLHDGANRLTM